MPSVVRNRSPETASLPLAVDVHLSSLDVIAQTALNIETDVHDEKNELLHAVRQYFSEAQNIAIELATLLPFLRPLMTFVNNHMTAGKMTDMAVRHVHEELSEIAKHPVDPKSQNFLHSMVGQFANGNLSKDELVGTKTFTSAEYQKQKLTRIYSVP